MQEPRSTTLDGACAGNGQQGWDMALIYIELQQDSDNSDTRSAARSKTALYEGNAST
jgi:hypothetical protein